MGTVTLGVSIAVPEPYGSLLQERRAGFGDPAAHGIPTHVTLLPPTEVDDAALPAIEAHLAEVAAAGRPFPMRLSGTGTFRPLSPVVFVQVVEGAAACTWLQKQVRDASGPCARELQFPYHPHVTVAHGIDEEAMDRAFEELADFAADLDDAPASRSTSRARTACGASCASTPSARRRPACRAQAADRSRPPAPSASSRLLSRAAAVSSTGRRRRLTSAGGGTPRAAHAAAPT